MLQRVDLRWEQSSEEVEIFLSVPKGAIAGAVSYVTGCVQSDGHAHIMRLQTCASQQDAMPGTNCAVLLLCVCGADLGRADIGFALTGNKIRVSIKGQDVLSGEVRDCT
jgi:hypothetical protein